MDELGNIYKEFEHQLQALFMLIHKINPETKIIMTVAPYPLIHAPKVLRNIAQPIYTKLADIARKVVGIEIEKNVGDVNNPNNLYDQPNKVKNPSVDGGGGLSWATFSGPDYTTSRFGDPNDIYKPNLLDIHPGLEGYGDLAMSMIDQMKAKGWLPSGFSYSEDNMLARAESVRQMHHAKTWGSLKATYKPADRFDDQTVTTLDDDYVYDVPVNDKDSSGDIIKYSAVRKEQNDWLQQTAINATSVIDGATDRIYLQRNLVLKNLDWSTNVGSIKKFSDYKKAIGNIGDIATEKYNKYFKKTIAADPTKELELYRLWEEEAINWYSQQIGTNAPSTAETEMINAYKQGTALMKKDYSWDMDGDHRFTASDIQLGQLITLLDDKKYKDGTAMPIIGEDGKLGKIDEIIKWSDFKTMMTRIITDTLTGEKLRVPSETDPKGFEFISDQDALNGQMSGGAYNHNKQLSQVSGVPTTPLNIDAGDSLAQVLKVLRTEKLDMITDLIVSNRGSIDSIVDIVIDLLDFSEVNHHVVKDFMTRVSGDWNLMGELLGLVSDVIADPGAWAAIADYVISKAPSLTILKGMGPIISTTIDDLNKKFKAFLGDASLTDVNRKLWTDAVVDFTLKLMTKDDTKTLLEKLSDGVSGIETALTTIGSTNALALKNALKVLGSLSSLGIGA